MGSRSSFVRKIIYLVMIAALLIPLYQLSHPSTVAAKGEQKSPGGVLTQLRDKYHLSQARIGQIDPTSVTIKLATLGMRGIAANILWEKANDFKMKKDWTNLGATLNQITKVQPNFINVWSNQAWNLSYNVSVEFDDYHQRYRWVIKGIEFLMEGIRYNERQPRLVWDLGWTISQKIGRADESKQYRRLFREDDDFHGSRPLAKRDNWLVGREEFERATAMAEAGMSMLGKSELIYRSSGPMCQMYYADYLEKDGTFGEVAKAAWAEADRDWKRYGSEDIPTSYRDEKTQELVIIRLGEEELQRENSKKYAAKLDALEPGLRERVVNDKLKALSKAQREAFEMPADKRTGKQRDLAAQAQESLKVTYNEVARRMKGSKREEALKLAKEAEKCDMLATYTERYRTIVNFVYWRTRAGIEQDNETLAARKAVYEGDRAYAEGDLIKARDSYQSGLAGWRKVLDKSPELMPNQTAGDDLIHAINRYHRILNQLDEPLPEPFILQDVVDYYRENDPSAVAAAQGRPKKPQDPQKPAGPKESPTIPKEK